MVIRTDLIAVSDRAEFGSRSGAALIPPNAAAVPEIDGPGKSLR